MRAMRAMHAMRCVLIDFDRRGQVRHGTDEWASLKEFGDCLMLCRIGHMEIPRWVEYQ